MIGRNNIGGYAMSKGKKKIRKLTDEQYNLYIAALKNNAGLYCADGETFDPKEIDKDKNKDRRKQEN